MLSPLSPLDDYPVHQISEPMRHVGTSDRNFYDRYYFNIHGAAGVHGTDDELFAVIGLGQYPNLGVADAFVSVMKGSDHRVVRSSKTLGADRMDTAIGPIRVEVIEGLRRVRVVVEPNDWGIELDAVYDGFSEAILEARHFDRQFGRVTFDSTRFAQTGSWTGTLRTGDDEITLTPDRWWGSRDRSWGIRPVGEPEGDGIRQGANVMSGMWNYFPMQFDDHAIMYICHERDDGERPLVQSERVWVDPDRPIEDLGRSEHEHHLIPGTRVIDRSVIRFPEAGLEITCTPLLANFVSIGTGYGIDSDWRHGMYHGPDPVTQGLVLAVDEVQGLAQYGIVDHVAEFSYDGHVGYGLLEHGFFGPYRHYGLLDGGMGAPAD